MDDQPERRTTEDVISSSIKFLNDLKHHVSELWPDDLASVAQNVSAVYAPGLNVKKLITDLGRKKFAGKDIEKVEDLDRAYRSSHALMHLFHGVVVAAQDKDFGVPQNWDWDPQQEDEIAERGSSHKKNIETQNVPVVEVTQNNNGGPSTNPPTKPKVTKKQQRKRRKDDEKNRNIFDRHKTRRRQRRKRNKNPI